MIIYVLHRKNLKYDQINCIQFEWGKLRYWSSGVAERLIYLLIQFYH